MVLEVDGEGLPACDGHSCCIIDIGSHQDSLSILDGSNGIGERFIHDVADLSDIFASLQRAGAVIVVFPLEVCGSRQGNVIVLLDDGLVGGIGHSRCGRAVDDEVAVEGAAINGEEETILRIVAGSRDLNVTVDDALSLDGYIYGRVGGVPANIKCKSAGRVGIDGGSVNNHVSVVI